MTRSRKKSETPEERAEAKLREIGVPPFVREFAFLPGSRVRFDFAWPEQKVAVEIEGGVWAAGRHVRGQGFIDDCWKYNMAAFYGWRVFRFVPKQISDDDQFAAMLRAVFEV